MRMWHVGTWFSGDSGAMVGLGLRGIFHSKQFCDSVTWVTLGLTSAGKCTEIFSFRTISGFWRSKLCDTGYLPVSGRSTAWFEVTFMIRFLPLSRKSFHPKLDLPVQSSVALSKFPRACYCPFFNMKLLAGSSIFLKLLIAVALCGCESYELAEGMKQPPGIQLQKQGFQVGA